MTMTESESELRELELILAESADLIELRDERLIPGNIDQSYIFVVSASNIHSLSSYTMTRMGQSEWF